MKTHLFLTIILFSFLQACSPIEPINELESAIAEEPVNPNKNRVIELYPHQGIYVGEDITAEYRPSEKIIYITTPHRLYFKTASIRIIEEDCPGSAIERVWGCNYHHYNININSNFFNCMFDTENGIYIEYDQYPRTDNEEDDDSSEDNGDEG